MHTSRILLIGFVWLLCIAGGARADDADQKLVAAWMESMKGTVEGRFDLDLLRFAKAEGLTNDQLRKLLAHHTYGSHGFPKGGVGIVDGARNLYVDLSNSRNAVSLQRENLSFGPRLQRQVVVIQGGKAVGALQLDGDGPITVLDFQPQRVQFLDFGSGIGGVYERE